jgi:hypothetical protein
MYHYEDNDINGTSNNVYSKTSMGVGNNSIPITSAEQEMMLSEEITASSTGIATLVYNLLVTSDGFTGGNTSTVEAWMTVNGIKLEFSTTSTFINKESTGMLETWLAKSITTQLTKGDKITVYFLKKTGTCLCVVKPSQSSLSLLM